MKLPKLPMKPNIDNYNFGKSIMAQMFALTTIYVFTTKIGIDLLTPTVIIGALADKHNIGNSTMSGLTEEQTSWIGSLIYLFPPMGSVTVSFLQNHFGHRVCMMLSNVSHIVSILLLVMCNSPEALYVSSALMGFNVGLITNFTVSYCGEVCEPRLRGILTSITNLFYYGGYLCVTSLYAITGDWKRSILYTLVFPLLNAAVLFKTPDSPMWLLSKGRIDEAKECLKWLRGDASDESCSAEFQEMIQYTTETKQTQLTPNGEKQKSSTYKESLKYFMQPETIKPLQMLIIFIFFANVLSGMPYTPYLLSIFETFDAPFQAAWATTIYTAFSVFGNVLTIFYINRLGKRFLVLSTMTICSICFLSIGAIGHFLPHSALSSWMKIVLFFMSNFFSSMGVMSIAWTLMCEIFPMKSKNIAAGISSASYYIMCFLMTKFYLNLEAVTGFYNTFILFGGIGLVGLVYMYFNLPETENKTLNEISEYFKNKNTNTKNQPI